MKGGYQTIDLKKTSLSGTAATVLGIHANIEGNYKKATLLTGLNFGGVEKADTFVTITLNSQNYECIAHGYKIVITPDDAVTATAVTLTDTDSIIAALKVAGLAQ